MIVSFEFHDEGELKVTCRAVDSDGDVREHAATGEMAEMIGQVFLAMIELMSDLAEDHADAGLRDKARYN